MEGMEYSGSQNELSSSNETQSLQSLSDSEDYANELKGHHDISQSSMMENFAPHTFDQIKCEEALVRFILLDELPFTFVEGEGFRLFMKEVCPQFEIPDRLKIASLVCKLYQMEKAKLMSVIKGQKVSITTDIWSTSIENIKYMVVTAHFIDNDWKLHRRVINFIKIDSYAGLDLGENLEACLRSWGIEKVLCIMVDNVSSNEPTIDAALKRLHERNGVDFKGDMRCVCHILNLIVKDCLEELYNSIEAIRNCVRYLDSSMTRLFDFKDCVGHFPIIPMDVAARWSSTYKMLKSAQKYEDVFAWMAYDRDSFMSYFNEQEEGEQKKVGPPCEEDWTKVKAFLHFLKKFYDSILMLSARNSCTSYLLLKVMAELLWDIDGEHSFDSNSVLHKMKCSIKEKFKKYWGDFDSVNKMIYVAHVLNPKWKFDMIETCFECIGYQKDQIKHIVLDIKKTLFTLFNEYKKVDDTSSSTTQTTAITESVVIGLSPFELQVKRKREAMEATHISNEVDKYFTDPCEKLDDESFDILNWWKMNQSRYPVLSKVAKDILSIPSSTVASEDAFNLDKKIVAHFKVLLPPKMAEALVCTKDWLKAEMLADEHYVYKEPMEDDLELCRELEVLEEGMLNVAAPENVIVTSSSS